MAVTSTDRFGLSVWGSGSDPFLRTQMNNVTETVGAVVAGFVQGAGTGSRPTVPDTDYAGFFYFDTTAKVLYYSDGATWTTIAGISGGAGSVTHAMLAADAVETDNIKEEAVHSGNILSLVASKLTGTIPNSVAHPVGPEEHKTYWGATLGAATETFSRIFVTTDTTPVGGQNGDICLVYTA